MTCFRCAFLLNFSFEEVECLWGKLLMATSVCSAGKWSSTSATSRGTTWTSTPQLEGLLSAGSAWRSTSPRTAWKPINTCIIRRRWKTLVLVPLSAHFSNKYTSKPTCLGRLGTIWHGTRWEIVELFLLSRLSKIGSLTLPTPTILKPLYFVILTR